MKDAMDVECQVAGLARVRDEELAGRESGPAARALVSSLVAERVHAEESVPRRNPGGWRLRRLVPAGVAVGAMAIAVVVGLGMVDERAGRATSYANSAMEVERDGDWFVARVKDPLANHALYAEAFRAVGKDVDIELVPVSPRLVGSVLEAGGEGPGRVRASTDLVDGGSGSAACGSKPESCTLVIRISADSTGSLRYKVGRAARPGEAHQDPDRGAGQPSAPDGSGTSTDEPATDGQSQGGSNGN